MSAKFTGFWSSALLAALTGVLSAQAPAPAPQQAPPEQVPRPNFSAQVDLVTTDAIVRDEKGNFVADLRKDEFEIYEDGVRQTISSMTLSHGGRVTNVLAPPPAAPAEGIILPPVRERNDISGRIFVFFFDDLHIQFHNTSRVRQLFKKIESTLVHDGDMFGIVSSGTSSISIEMTYDKRRLDEAINKMTGEELTPLEIINSPDGSQGPAEVRHRVHVAFSTVEDLLNNLEKVHNRRKALVYVSDGYDFVPFQDARLGAMDPSSPFAQNSMKQTINQQMASNAQQDGGTSTGFNPSTNPDVMASKQNEEFADADLSRELADLTRTANRANTTIYTIDPRGLVGPMSDLDQEVDPRQWAEFVRKSQDSLRVLADDTGGVAIVNQNDFDKGLKRIDAETSDYYVLGYYSTNPDPLKKRRRIEVRVTRPSVSIYSRKEYILRSPQAPAKPADKAPDKPVATGKKK
jgi:VWFA-related protein